jgi:hypothetical protein
MWGDRGLTRYREGYGLCTPSSTPLPPKGGSLPGVRFARRAFSKKMENASLSPALEYPLEALTDAKLANSFALTEQVSSRSDPRRLRTHAHLFSRRLCVCVSHVERRPRPSQRLRMDATSSPASARGPSACSMPCPTRRRTGKRAFARVSWSCHQPPKTHCTRGARLLEWPFGGLS